MARGNWSSYRNLKIPSENKEITRVKTPVKLKILKEINSIGGLSQIGVTEDGYLYYIFNGVAQLMGRKVPDDTPTGYWRGENIAEMHGIKYSTTAKLRMGINGKYPQVLNAEEFVIEGHEIEGGDANGLTI